jgi:hypothetical protein
MPAHPLESKEDELRDKGGGMRDERMDKATL